MLTLGRLGSGLIDNSQLDAGIRDADGGHEGVGASVMAGADARENILELRLELGGQLDESSPSNDVISVGVGSERHPWQHRRRLVQQIFDPN